jgi:antitoxin component YwqK of YwqJK toxin-antitoxin module
LDRCRKYFTMNKYNLIAFSLLFSLSISEFSAQNQTDSKGKKQGVWVKYAADGKTPLYKGTFKDGKPTGKFFYFYPNGETSSILEHVGGGKAKCRMYHENGNVMAVGNYLNQQKDSTWWYFNSSKMVLNQENYANGQKEGYFLQYLPSYSKTPQIIEEKFFRNGKEEGAWKQYYKNGQVKLAATYKLGLLAGKCTWYSASGTVELVGYYKDGLKNGWWKEKVVDGEVKKYYFRDSELTGERLEKHLEIVKKNQTK